MHFKGQPLVLQSTLSVPNDGEEAEESRYAPENTRADKDLQSIPGQALLNTVMSVLSRRKLTISGSKKYQLFFQNFAATKKDCSVAFFGPEALFFPRIFYKQ